MPLHRPPHSTHHMHTACYTALLHHASLHCMHTACYTACNDACYTHTPPHATLHTTPHHTTALHATVLMTACHAACYFTALHATLLVTPHATARPTALLHTSCYVTALHALCLLTIALHATHHTAYYIIALDCPSRCLLHHCTACTLHTHCYTTHHCTACHAARTSLHPHT